MTSWLYHASRRDFVLTAKPNGGHEALASLVKGRGDEVLVVNQNIDELLERAGMDTSRVNLHGSFGDVRCADDKCSFVKNGGLMDPSFPDFVVPEEEISDLNNPLPVLSKDDLPYCPKCKHSLLRPGILWFGEDTPKEKLQRIDAFLRA